MHFGGALCCPLSVNDAFWDILGCTRACALHITWHGRSATIVHSNVAAAVVSLLLSMSVEAASGCLSKLHFVPTDVLSNARYSCFALYVLNLVFIAAILSRARKHQTPTLAPGSSAGALHSVGACLQVVITYALGTAVALAAFWACPNQSTLQWLAVATVGFFLYGPQMLIGLCGAEVVSPSAVGASQGFLGWISYLGQTPLSFMWHLATIKFVQEQKRFAQHNLGICSPLLSRLHRHVE